jgi:hypothetical protein
MRAHANVWITSLFVLLFVGLAGCKSMQKALGMKTDLEDKPVQELWLHTGDAEELCPGAQVPLTVTAILEDGQHLVSEGAGDGKVTWDNYEIHADGGELVRPGVFALSSDPRATLDGPATLLVRSKHHPDKSVEASLPARYDCTYTADFSGRNGRDGAHGEQGSSGGHGTNNQSSPSYAEPGGHGEHGQNGGHGADGEPGEDAEETEVFVALAQGDMVDGPLLEILVQSRTTDHAEIFLVDPYGGQLTVLARGGRGGHGGKGGSGGSGGSGGTGEPPGNGGDGGDGGDGGNGASGGDGAPITVVVDPAAKDYLDVLHLDNSGGPGGQPGPGGFGGSGGNAHSGGQQGRRGDNGRDGTRAGRSGRDGPEPQVLIEEVSQVW